MPLPRLKSGEYAEWRDALRMHGAFVYDRALSCDASEEARMATRALMSDAQMLKAHPYDPHKRTGYTPPGVEGTKTHKRNTSRHFFDYKPTMHMGGKYEALRRLYCELAQRGLQVTGAVEEHIKKTVPLCKGEQLFRATQYLNQKVEPGIELFPSHIDFSLLTLFVGGASEGLEIMHGGEWEPVSLAPHEVLVGAGSILRQYWSEVRALRHRVVAGSTGRISLFMFVEPKEDALLPSGERMKDFLDRVLREVRT